MATTNYKPGGFSNLGATPGLLDNNYSSPLGNKLFAGLNQKQDLSSQIGSTKLPAAPATPTGTIKKSEHSDANGNSVTYHYDVPKLGDNPGLINNPSNVVPSTPNSKDATTGLYSSGSNFNTTPNVTTSNAPAPILEPTKPVPTIPSTATGLVGTAQQAKDIADEYAKKITDVGDTGAKEALGYGSTGSSSVGAGNALAVKNAVSSRLDALAKGETAALSGIGYQQGGFEKAGSLVSPTGAFPFVFDPATGTFKTPDGTANAGAPTLSYNPQTDANALAQSVISGKVPYADAVSALGYAGSVGKGLLTNAITAQGGNLTEIQAKQEATQSNITTAGTATANYLATLKPLEAASTAAKGIESTISTYLNQNPDINSSPLAVGNLAQQWIQGKQLTDPKYQTFFNYLNEYASTLAPILGVGGDPTNMKTEIAQSFVNAQASGKSIQAVLKDMTKLAEDKLANLKSGATGGGIVNKPTGNTIVAPDGTQIIITD